MLSIEDDVTAFDSLEGVHDGERLELKVVKVHVVHSQCENLVVCIVI